MLRKIIIKLLVGLALVIPAAAVVGCQSTDAERPQAFTGQEHRGKPRFEAHGKGMQWGRVVYDHH